MTKIPVIILSGRSSSTEKVTGLSLGADDYITKPFDPPELRASVELRLRKAQKKGQTNESFAKGSLTFDLSRQKVSFKKKDTQKELAGSGYTLQAVYGSGYRFVKA